MSEGWADGFSRFLWIRKSSLGYLAAAIAQGALGFLTVATISRVLGLSGVASWGLQQLTFQAFSLTLTLGLPPLVAAVAVRASRSTTDALHTYHTAFRLVVIAGFAASALSVASLLLGSARWVPATALAGAAMALLQVTTSWLRGSERHGLNVIVLTGSWVAAYLAGIATVLVTRSISLYWIGFTLGLACGITAAIRAEPVLWRKPSGSDFPLLRQGLFGLPHLVANTLQVGLLRPLGSVTAGSTGVAYVTVAGQYAQAMGVLQQAYWSTRGQHAIRAIEEKSITQVRKLSREAVAIFVGAWAVYAALAPTVLELLLGRAAPQSMVLMALLLGAMPLASIRYDTYAGTLWRQHRSRLLSGTTVVSSGIGLLLSAVAAYRVGLAALPIGLLLARVAQGLITKRAVQHGR
jgi:O-antigen/teichoic acid export membrane protein